MKYQLIFSNKPSDLNKKLIKFFNMNLLSLNKASLIFNFEVAHPEAMDKYIARGITNYPVLMYNTTSVTGVEKIIKYLGSQVENHNNRILNKSPDEKMDDYWKSTIGGTSIDSSGNVKVDDDDDDDNDSDLHRKIQSAFDARNNASIKQTHKQKGRSNNVKQQPTVNNLDDNYHNKPSDTFKNISKTNDADDDLMARFFENNEPSVGSSSLDEDDLSNGY